MGEKLMQWKQGNSKTLIYFKRRAEKLDIHPNEREWNLQIDVEWDRNMFRRVQGEVKSHENTMKEVENKVRKKGLNKWSETIRNKPSLNCVGLCIRETEERHNL